MDRVVGLFKDIEAKPDLLAGITESASGGSVITFSIEDNGPYDADDTPGGGDRSFRLVSGPADWR